MIPQVGQRLQIKPARVVYIEQAEALFGPINIIVLRDKAGQLYKWVTETRPKWASRWNLIDIRATVKAVGEGGMIEVKRVVHEGNGGKANERQKNQGLPRPLQAIHGG